MADHEATNPAKVSPKVWAGLATGLAIAAIGGLVTAVTPDTFDFLGPWGVIAYTGVTVGLAQLAAWLKNDPARTGSVPPAASASVLSGPEGGPYTPSQ